MDMMNQQTINQMNMGMGGMMCSVDVTDQTTSVVTEITRMDVEGENSKRYGKMMSNIMITDHKKWEAKYFNNWGNDLRRYVEYSFTNNLPDRAELVDKYNIKLWHDTDHSAYSKESVGKYNCGDSIYTVTYYGLVQMTAEYRRGDKKAYEDLERYSHSLYEGIKLMCGIVDVGK